MTGGAVAVTRGGHQTAVEVPELEGDVHVDVEGDRAPHVEVPAGVDVYHRPDGEDDEDELATDGGATISRTTVAARGLGLSEGKDFFALGLGGLGFTASGWLWGLGQEGTAVAAMVVFIASSLLGWVGALTYGARKDRGGGV